MAVQLPQWSPVVTTGTTAQETGLTQRAIAPQWSPVVTTGTTRRARWRLYASPVAAMEPRRDDGDDTARSRCTDTPCRRRNGAPS